MKRKVSLIFGLSLFVAFTALGQTAPAKKPAVASSSCYGEWMALFRERGAKPVPNGSHEVIISIRNEQGSQCYVGKAEVSEGKIMPPILIQKQDGSFEPVGALGKQLDPTWLASQNKDTLYEIVDGASMTFYTTEKEFGKLFFYKFLNDKPKANKVAPPPSALVKN